MKVEFEDLTEEEISVFEEYRKEKAELEKTDKARYEELQCAVNNIITALSPQEHFIFKEAFKLVDKPSGNEDGEADLRFEVTLQRLHQIEAKALRRLRFLRRASGLKDYLDDTLYVLVEDTVPEEQKTALQNACESFAKRMNLKNANITFLNNPSALDFSYPDDSGLPKGFFDKNVLLISYSEPCLSWFERSCIIPLRKNGKMVPRYISVQPKILSPDEAHWTPDYHNTVFAYPSFSKIAKFKGVIILADDEYVPRPVDFDLLAEHFEKKKSATSEGK